MALDETTVLLSDLEDIRQVLGACQTYFTAEDVKRAQLAFGRIKKAPITQEIERVQERVSGILGDFLLERYEAETDAEAGSEAPEGAEGQPEGTEEAGDTLPEYPLGRFKAPRQVGKILEPPANA